MIKESNNLKKLEQITAFLDGKVISNYQDNNNRSAE